MVLVGYTNRLSLDRSHYLTCRQIFLFLINPIVVGIPWIMITIIVPCEDNHKRLFYSQENQKCFYNNAQIVSMGQDVDIFEIKLCQHTWDSWRYNSFLPRWRYITKALEPYGSISTESRYGGYLAYEGGCGKTYWDLCYCGKPIQRNIPLNDQNREYCSFECFAEDYFRIKYCCCGEPMMSMLRPNWYKYKKYNRVSVMLKWLRIEQQFLDYLASLKKRTNMEPKQSHKAVTCNKLCNVRQEIQKSPAAIAAMELERRLEIDRKLKEKYKNRPRFWTNDKLHNPRLPPWAKAVKDRDKYRCQIPGCTETRFLDAHHLNPQKFFSEQDCDLDNGITLCQSHHMRFHHEYRGKDIKSQFSQFQSTTPSELTPREIAMIDKRIGKKQLI